ncbi:hypothetical protein [Paracoccus aminophilus]|uniref:Lipoprotein n=1 Tax=Paracoccus aminophilus JCM 7686 TaxID=1367847 RepID=S5Y8K5_PARAH|nr:hypothetical protein [Paracoccus aminophilus]AGT07658.1 hypothetical protein JCM7686_0549 [Paracoccus aminophilus JCM 7686]
MKQIVASAFFASALGALFLAGCAPQDKYASVIAGSVPPSAEVKAKIVRNAKAIVYDPSSIRGAEISNMATFADGTQGVCVKADVKNAQGKYLGVHTMGVALNDDPHLAANALQHPVCDRADVTWHPFPELNHLKKR